jgi:hypothetical protein
VQQEDAAVVADEYEILVVGLSIVGAWIVRSCEINGAAEQSLELE